MNDIIEVQAPEKKSQQPDYTIPIMLQFTKEDTENAGVYTDCTGCLVATALKREGYKHVRVGSHMVRIFKDPMWSDPVASFKSDEIFHDALCNGSNNDPNWYGYKSDVVGRRIVLYPA